MFEINENIVGFVCIVAPSQVSNDVLSHCKKIRTNDASRKPNFQEKLVEPCLEK